MSTTSTSSRRHDAEEAEKVEIPRGPNIKRPPEHKPLGDSLEARIATVQPDDISTGDLAPDGVEVMAYRSNVPAIAEFTFRHRDPEFRKRLKEWGSGFIVAGQQLRPGLIARARRAGAAAPRGQGGDREVVRADPPAQPDRAGDRRADVRRRGATTRRPRWGRRGRCPALREELKDGAEHDHGQDRDDGEELHADPRLLRARARDPGRRRPAVVLDGDSADGGSVAVKRVARSSSDCVARPTRPRSSYRTLSAVPTPSLGDSCLGLEADPLAGRLAVDVRASGRG